jgi:tRNA threonylcarbamoyladenosine biosynthesis protein TsaB
MRYLYLDTSSSFLYAGIIEDDKLLAEISEEMDCDLSRIALLKISEMFNKVNLKPNDIDKIIVVNGPGSFTGIRVGITIAKTYAWGLKKDITTVTSLEAMAISSNFDGYKVPLIDARRGYVYGAIFDKDNNEVVKSSHINLDLLKNKINEYKNVVIITNDELDLEYKNEEYRPNILRIVEKYKDRENVNPHFVNPEYLKLTEAEEKNNKND